MMRHFTATAFVVDGPRTLLHWHKRLQQWMPPGGHIEADEDPAQAVLREVAEETGLLAEVIPVQPTAAFAYPMLSIKLLREHPDDVRRALARRHTEAPLEEALAVDTEWRRVLAEVESLRAERNTISKEIGELSRLAKTAGTKDAKHAEHRR